MMAAARCDLLPRPVVVDRMPLGYDMEVGWNIEQAPQQQGSRLAGHLFERKDANVVVIHAEMTTVRLELRIAHLPIEMTRIAQRCFFNLGGAEVYETPDEPEGPLRPQQLDRREVVKLPT